MIAAYCGGIAYRPRSETDSPLVSWTKRTLPVDLQTQSTRSTTLLLLTIVAITRSDVGFKFVHSDSVRGNSNVRRISRVRAHPSHCPAIHIHNICTTASCTGATTVPCIASQTTLSKFATPTQVGAGTALGMSQSRRCGRQNYLDGQEFSRVRAYPSYDPAIGS